MSMGMSMSMSKTKDNLLDYYKELGVESVIIKEDGERGLYSVSYQHAGVDFNDPKIRMARGLVLDSEGNIVLRGFEKFFNYLQLEGNENYNEDFKTKFSRLQLEDKNSLIEVEEKLDGTMILLGMYNNELVVSTSSSLTNDYCHKALKYFNSSSNLTIIKEHLKLGNTLAFEYISPTNQVVVKYQTEEYVLLSSISNQTGKELSVSELEELSTKLGIRKYSTSVKTLEELIGIQRNGKGIEGFIVKNSYNKRIKFKVDSWFEFSRTYNLFYGKTSKRNILEVLEMYLEDKHDDLLAFENQHSVFSQQGKASYLVNVFDNIFSEAQDVYEKYLTGEYDTRHIATVLEPKHNVVIYIVLNRIKTLRLNEKDGEAREEYTELVKGRIVLKIHEGIVLNSELE